ncbi:MAG: DNA alkylation repair protein [Planctomycetia bacterium]
MPGFTTPVIPPEILLRKGARTTATVPEKVRKLLNLGVLETVNLVEWLVVDQKALALKIADSNGWSHLRQPLQHALDSLSTKTAPRMMQVIGKTLAKAFPGAKQLDKALAKLQNHRSDIVRSWCCYMIGANEVLDLDQSMKRIYTFAADRNMSVRETAWLGLRGRISNQLDDALKLLAVFAMDADANVRRFSSEVTRPRGVWCSHIEALKEKPAMGLQILNPLKSDSSKYVRDSVGNWLNDASKTQPEWVTRICSDWQKQSPTRDTAYIIRRATRSLRKK